MPARHRDVRGPRQIQQGPARTLPNTRHGGLGLIPSGAHSLGLPCLVLLDLLLDLPYSPVDGCLEEKAFGPRPLRSVRRRSPSYAVATGCCYRFRTEQTGFGDKTGRFTLRIVGGEAGIRTLGPLGLRFSSLGQGVRGGSLMTDSRGNRPIPGPRTRRRSPVLLPAVATGTRPLREL